MKFKIGDKVKVDYDCKWDKQTVHVTDIHMGFYPVLYSCKALDGTKLAFFENELQSLYEHDMDMLKYWGK